MHATLSVGIQLGAYHMALEVYVMLLLLIKLTLARSINYVTSAINLDFRFFMKPTTGHTERVRLS